MEPRLRDRAHGARRGEEIRKAEHGVAAEARPPLQPHPGLGDHAERAFGADHHAVGAGACAGAGQAAGLHRARGGDRAQAFDEIVDVGVERGEMAAGARRDPAAQRRELEALRIVPDGEAVRFQRRLDRRSPDAALDSRRPARLVDLEHPVQAAHIEAHRAGIGAADRRLDAADDRGAGAERNNGDLGAARPVEHVGDIGFVLGQGDEVRRIGEVAREGADGFRIGLAVGMQEPLVRL